MIIDAHLDMSLNAIEYNRDYRRSVADIRAREQGMTDKIDRGKGVVSLPELRKAGIGLVVATQIARYTEEDRGLPGLSFNSPQQAWAMTQAQRAWYEAMEDDDSQGFPQMRQIRDRAGLETHLALWLNSTVPNEQKPVGYILSLEGADSFVRVSYIEKAYAYGLRAIGPAHYGPGRYAPGTGMTGPLTPMGQDLVREMDRLNMILDVTHLTDEGFDMALDLFKGQVWASHHNCRALVPHQRQLSDDQIRRLVERGAVIGGCFDAWMMKPGLTQRKSNPAEFGVLIETILDHYDHICQIAGNANHVAIGSDLDGTFGLEQSPADLQTIADLARLPDLLAKRGYSQPDIDGVMYGNWLRFLRGAWK